MNLKPYLDIFMAMARTGILGYGGGPSVIPLFRHEAVLRYKWISDEEFGEILAFANALPGPIATKMAAQLGYRQKGTIGACLAVIAHIFPTTIGIVGLLGLLYTLKESVIVAGMIAAVRPVIAVLLGIMAYEFCSKTWKGLGKVIGLLSGIIAFLLLTVVNVHPAISIMLFLAYGTIHIRLSNWMRQKRNRKKENMNQDREGIS
ncbi:chromate transporter [Bacillus sp. FJAT-29790]|uniref:chromate transporter n=1 Tax=Bacillus sp. FJAT-29790 TaxID=1895002 RepID=UPI001C212B85|nr:chromate transporter [Bacillus sp. FJAT-29790]MBU8878687.1 chromate transporter [Bacillus sp. FJAT-29790]